MNRTQKIIVLLVIVCGIASAFYSPFPSPPLPACNPPDMTRGYATLIFFDPFSEQQITNVSLSLAYLPNGSTYQNTRSGEVFYVAEPSYWFAMKEGFWNASGFIIANGMKANEIEALTTFLPPCPATYSNEPYESVGCLIRRCPLGNVKVGITALDDIEGNFTSDTIPDGHHKLKLHYEITGDYYNTSGWGFSAYTPAELIENLPYASTYDLPCQLLWIRWNGTLVNYQVDGLNYPVFNVGPFNSTLLKPLVLSGDQIIEADFQSVRHALLYYGFVDEVWQWTIPF